MYVCTTKYPSRSSNTQKINNNSRKMFVEEERAKERNAEQWERYCVCPVSFCTSHPSSTTTTANNNYNKQDL